MTNKLRYFIANWKMYGDIMSLKSIERVIKFTKLNKKKNFKLIYCPPYTLLYPFLKKIKNTNIGLGAQNCHSENDYGPYTGNINAKMIKKIGANYVIIGHSENRKNGETNFLINKKIKSAIKNKLNVIFCIGETILEKKKKNTFKVIKYQIIKGLKGVRSFNKIIIAYEPVWSIGTGIVPNNLELMKNINFIKHILKKDIKAPSIKIIYGGSVNPNNVLHLNSISSIDGYLIGGASQNSKKFIDIVKKSFI